MIRYTLFVFLLVSCVRIDDGSDQEIEFVEVSIELNAEKITIDNTEDVDVFFFSYREGTGFVGIKDNVEVDISVNLDSEFSIEPNYFGYSSSIEKVIQLNDKYDLLKGTVFKFIQAHDIERNDTIFKIEPTGKLIADDTFLLFNKKKYEFVSLEDGFDIINLSELPRHLIDNKLYYRKSGYGGANDAIRFIDLNDPLLQPETLISAEYITRFAFNSNMDLFYGGGATSLNRFVHSQTNNVMNVSGLNYGLISHFTGLDGEFYAQSFLGSLQQPRLGFYKIEVGPDQLNTNNIFIFNRDLYPNHSFLGKANIVISNPKRNSSLIIDSGGGQGTLDTYELKYADNSIEYINFPINSLVDIYSFNNEFVIYNDYISRKEYQLIKINLSDYSEVYSKSLDYFGNNFLLDKLTGSVYFLEQNNGKTKFNHLSSANELEIFKFENEFYSLFSIIK